MKDILYIGLNGYAGSGKDTVAKMLHCILNGHSSSKEDCWNLFLSNYSTIVRPYATYTTDTTIPDYKCTCIAFADQLKNICSCMFGIPVEYFYYNKENSWVCINKDFHYTENKPNQNNIINSEEYYNSKNKYQCSDERYYMSLREILVYVGTYVCQDFICGNIFINSVNNRIQTLKKNTNKNLRYAICTDVRFMHEFDYIKKNHGIMINITRDSIIQSNNIAEHDLDTLEPTDYDIVIYNNGTYEELFNCVWDTVHNIEDLTLQNKTIQLDTRDENIYSYIRIIKENNNIINGKICSEQGMVRVMHDQGNIVVVDLIGGPKLQINQTVLSYNGKKYLISKIYKEILENVNNDINWMIELIEI